MPILFKSALLLPPHSLPLRAVGSLLFLSLARCPLSKEEKESAFSQNGGERDCRLKVTNASAREETVPPPPFPLNGRPRGTSYLNRGVGEASNPNLPHSHCPTRKKKEVEGLELVERCLQLRPGGSSSAVCPFPGGLLPPSANIPTTPFLPSFLPSVSYSSSPHYYYYTMGTQPIRRV